MWSPVPLFRGAPCHPAPDLSLKVSWFSSLFSRTYLPSPFSAASERPRRQPTAATGHASFTMHPRWCLGYSSPPHASRERPHSELNPAVHWSVQHASNNYRGAPTINPSAMHQPVPSCSPLPSTALRGYRSFRMGKGHTLRPCGKPTDGTVGDTEIAAHLPRGWVSVNLLVFFVCCVSVLGVAWGELRCGFARRWTRSGVVVPLSHSSGGPRAILPPTLA